MNTGRTIFSQIMDFLPMNEFRSCVKRYRGTYKVQTFSCLDQYLCMAFAQMTFRESLRDIETCLRSFGPKLYHAGFRSSISRSTLAHTNEHRDWRIYADFAHVLIKQARQLYVKDDFGVALKQTAYAFDSTTIDLCLSLFPWAQFRKKKAAVKLHTLIDLRGNIPCVIHITDGKVHDVNALDCLVLEPGAFYIIDRGYIDFMRLYVFVTKAAFFVTRAKKNFKYIRLSYRPVDKKTGLRSDQTIRLKGFQVAKDYPAALRRISYIDPETNKKFVFLTNNFSLPALTFPQLYKCRWQVELFFKWIKQHLRIKAFYGTNENAVKTQIWIAISIYVLVSILKKKLNVNRSLSEILQILSITIFEKMPLYQVLTKSDLEDHNNVLEKQLILNI